MTAKPESNEHDPYYRKYIDRVPDGDIAATLGSQVESTLAFLRNVSEENAGRSYAAGKWTMKQVLGHLIDSERIFAYRALCVGRNDKHGCLVLSRMITSPTRILMREPSRVSSKN